MGCKDIGIRKPEFVAKTQFIYKYFILDISFITLCQIWILKMNNKRIKNDRLMVRERKNSSIKANFYKSFEMFEVYSIYVVPFESSKISK